jgi:hypothetical protein
VDIIALTGKISVQNGLSSVYLAGVSGRHHIVVTDVAEWLQVSRGTEQGGWRYGYHAWLGRLLTVQRSSMQEKNRGWHLF